MVTVPWVFRLVARRAGGGGFGGCRRRGRVRLCAGRAVGGGRGLGGRAGGVGGRARRRRCRHEVFVLPAHQAPVDDQLALAADRHDASGAGHQLGAVRLAGVHLVVEGLGFGLQLLDLCGEPVALGGVAGVVADGLGRLLEPVDLGRQLREPRAVRVGRGLGLALDT